MKSALTAKLTARRPRTREGLTRAFQGVFSSEHPLVVVSTTQVEDWDDSSSFLMEWLLRPLSLASIDLMSMVCFVSQVRFLCGSWGDSAKRLLLGGECSSELLGVAGASPGGEKSSSFCPFRLSRAGLMRGLRWRKEPELEAMELATEGAGDGRGEAGKLLDSREK